MVIQASDWAVDPNVITKFPAVLINRELSPEVIRKGKLENIAVIFSSYFP